MCKGRETALKVRNDIRGSVDRLNMTLMGTAMR